MIPFDEGAVFIGSEPPPEGNSHRQLESRARALGEILKLQEQSVIEQSRRVEKALGEVKAVALARRQVERERDHEVEETVAAVVENREVVGIVSYGDIVIKGMKSLLE